MVDDRRALMHEELTHSMQGLDVLLLDALHRNEPHRRTAGCLDDRLGIVPVVLVCLDERRHELRTDELYLDAAGLQLPRPMMRRGTSLHDDESWLQADDRLHEARPADLRAVHDRAATDGAVQLEHPLGQVDPENVDLHVGLHLNEWTDSVFPEGRRRVHLSRSACPAMTKNSSTAPAMSTARTARRRACAASRPPVSARKTGSMLNGSSTTNSVTNSLKSRCISEQGSMWRPSS